MPRKPRMFIPGIPCHVIQRGNNRSVCFYEEENYLFYIDCLSDACRRYEVELHAYVLMTNHVHILMTPSTEVGISLVMQSIGRRYVQYINKRFNRSGTLFEGRFKASLVQDDNYLITCMRYIELNPVRAKMVSNSAQYTWSSFLENTGLIPRKIVVPHQSYLALQSAYKCAEEHYFSLFEGEMSKRVIDGVSNAWRFNMPYGSSRFITEIENTLKRKIGFAKLGRPVK